MVKFSKGAVGKTAAGLPILALASAAWVVTLAGLAIARHIGGEAGLGFLWFVWAFEGFVLFFCILHLIEVGAGFSLAHAATASLLAVVTVLTILETESLNQTRKLSNGSNRYHNGIICAFAGFLALSVLNLLLVIILGTQHNPGTSSHQKGQNMSSQGAVTGTQYGTGAGVTPAAGQGYGAPVTMV